MDKKQKNIEKTKKNPSILHSHHRPNSNQSTLIVEIVLDRTNMNHRAE